MIKNHYKGSCLPAGPSKGVPHETEPDELVVRGDSVGVRFERASAGAVTRG